MNTKYKRIYCCTPFSFRADENTFFIRDTGLISRSIRKMGVDSKVIMPLPYHDGDLRDEILRTEYKNLESEKWWKSLGIDGLVLYSWGAPRYRKIARAVHKAGIRLHIHMDSSGEFGGPYRDDVPMWKRLYMRMMCRVQDIFRSWHLRQADVVSMCPTAADVVSRRLFYGRWLRDRNCPMPCPVSSLCAYDGRQKEELILCIGRWDDVFQKRPEMMMATLEAYYARGGTAESRIYGNITPALKEWYAGLKSEYVRKIKIVGYIPNNRLREEYQKARVILCPSRFESSHIVSAEALCCGCSVVTAYRPESLRDLFWYTTKESGTVAKEDTPESLADALRQELRLWRDSKRNPEHIAAAWQPYFHADKVLNEIFS